MGLRDRKLKTDTTSFGAEDELAPANPALHGGQAMELAEPAPLCQPEVPATHREIEPSKVPPAFEPFSSISDSMQLRSPGGTDLERLHLHREAMDAFNALKTRLQYLSSPDQQELKHLLIAELDEDVEDFDHEFDLKEEINGQLRMLRTMRSRAERETLSTREMKETLTAASSLISMLIKEQEKVLNIDRLRTIERAVVEAVKTLPTDAQEAFLTFLEDKLDGYSRQ